MLQMRRWCGEAYGPRGHVDDSDNDGRNDRDKRTSCCRGIIDVGSDFCVVVGQSRAVASVCDCVVRHAGAQLEWCDAGAGVWESRASLISSRGVPSGGSRLAAEG